MSKPIFHIQESALLELGFEKETYYDKNCVTDTINTLKFEDFRRNLTPEIQLKVTYAYETSDGVNYALFETVSELVVEDGYAPICVNSLKALVALAETLQCK